MAPHVRRSFDLSQEPAGIRERYGRTQPGRGRVVDGAHCAALDKTFPLVARLNIKTALVWQQPWRLVSPLTVGWICESRAWHTTTGQPSENPHRLSPPERQPFPGSHLS